MDIQYGQKLTTQKFWPSTSSHWNKKPTTLPLGTTTTSLTVLQICWLRRRKRTEKGSQKQKVNPSRRKSPRSQRKRKPLDLGLTQNLLEKVLQINHLLKCLPHPNPPNKLRLTQKTF